MTAESPARPSRFKHPMKLKLERGGVLLATLVFVIILSASAASVLGLSLYSYRLAMRNEVRAQAKAVAETEMDWIYYKFMNLILGGTDPWDTVALLAVQLPSDTGADGSTVIPTTDRSPFLEAHRTAGWIVRRSAVRNQMVVGQIPGTNKRGTIFYIDIRIEVVPPPSNSFAGSVSERVGRYFQCSRTSIFQYAVFFQGDLEMAPGRDMMVNGDVSANGSIYMGTLSAQNATITLNNQVRYLADGYFNTLSDGTTTVYRKPNTPQTPVLDRAPAFGTSQDVQVEKMTKPENLLGGVDADALVVERPDLFPTVNDVYRSLIAPSPDDAGSLEYPSYNSSLGDNPTISAQRMYNRASLRITVEADGTVHFRKKGASVDCDSAFTGTNAVLTDFAGASVTNVYDQREARNVNVIEIQVDKLATALAASFPGTDPNDDANTFNGTLYVNLKNGDTNCPPAIRLINGQATPTVSSKGFSVATNGGIYVQSDNHAGSYSPGYNTIPKPDGSANPAMLMGDSVTLLSSNWDDAHANQDISMRNATGGTATISGGVLTGNVSATATTQSGGAQNLLRYLENWSGTDVIVLGSLGRLFDSKYYIRPYQQPSSGVYGAPLSRMFTYESALQTVPPPDSPVTIDFSRGSFFNW